MALQKNKSTAYGNHASYHKIIQTNINWWTLECTILLGSWISATARANKQDPIMVTPYTWRGDDFPFVNNAGDVRPVANVVATVYQRLKGLEEWEGAEDV